MTDLPTDAAPETNFRCGKVALIGRPNVGKSTLLNGLVGQKVSIVTRRAQTTRHRILGIATTRSHQAVYVDTPGMHRDGKRAINRHMNRAAAHGIDDVDLVLFVVEAGRWKGDDDWVLEKLKTRREPIILIANKVDRVHPKSRLLPWLQETGSRGDFVEVLPMSARRAGDIRLLAETVEQRLPVAEPMYPSDELTDRNVRFLAAEIIREKLMQRLSQEIPHRLTVAIEQFKEDPRGAQIDAIIWVESPGQKAAAIGAGGEVLKAVGIKARADIERLIEQHVRLNLWVKIKSGWSDDESQLRSLGYHE